MEQKTLPKLVNACFTQEQIEAIDGLYFADTTTGQGREFCYCVSASLGLNPLLGEVMFLPRRQKIKERGVDKWVTKIEPLVGRDGYLAIAHRSGEFDGMDVRSEIREMPRLTNGEWATTKTLVATCEVYRKGISHPFVAEVSYGEYVQLAKDGKPTKIWLEKPDIMIRKVAESQALRKAFNIHGTYCPEELGIGYIDQNGKLVVDKESPAVPLAGETISESITDSGDQVLTEGNGALVSEEQAAMIVELANEVGADLMKFSAYLGIEHISDLPESRIGEAVGQLERKRLANIKAAQRVLSGQKTPDILADLSQKNIPAKVEHGYLYATPAYRDPSAITLLRGMGFAQQGRNWVLQSAATA